MCPFSLVRAQRLIQYESGMGSRDASNSDVWILYRGVHAIHEGMHLYADSALLNMKQNDFMAFRKVRIVLSDTTTLWGDRLYYDGNTKIINIWGDTVTLVDGATTLKTDRLTYDRNLGLAYYNTWGHATNKDITLDSKIGRYDANIKEFYIYDEVRLFDPSSILLTDTLLYNTVSSQARIVCATYIFSDSATIYSEQGSYNTATHYALSTQASHVWTRDHQQLVGDTLHFYQDEKHGLAYGHVWIYDSLNNVQCSGGFGETHQSLFFSLVTDSAQVVMVDSHNDTVFLRADSIWVRNTEGRELESAEAYHHVRVYRPDVQAVCDSAYYSAADSVMRLYYDPVVWYDTFQCSADTIFMYRDTGGVRLVQLRNNTFAIERVDPLKYNQMKGHDGNVYFRQGEPDYADILGSAQMVYYITEDGPMNMKYLVGVNVGVGSDIRIYFQDRRPVRLVTMGDPDMQTYPLDMLPADKKTLPGFRWIVDRRPVRQQFETPSSADNMAEPTRVGNDID